MICSNCRVEFEGKFKTCDDCRRKNREWKEKNRDRVMEYVQWKRQMKEQEVKKVNVVYGRRVEEEDWEEYESQRDAAKKLGLQTSNVCKVIKGELKKTGGYVFKIEEKEKIVDKNEIKTWEEVKKEKNIEENVKGKPSPQRINHEEREGVIGKKCVTCKEWRSLDMYNSAKRWDNLRSDCKECLVKYRKDNRRRIQDTMNIYEKKRKEVDPNFKLSKTLRSRLGSALRCQNAEKRHSTLELTGCSIEFLRGYLEAKFKDGMTWENHGKWHIDHIIPCASFDLTKDDEVKKCFHYTNLQPLWSKENLEKGCK